MIGNSAPHPTVILIDDDDVNRENVCRLLPPDRWKVLEANTAKDGRELLSQTDSCCVLLDFLLLDRDGLELLREIVDARIPVVMMVAQGRENLAVEAMKLGAEDYLPKTGISSETLDRALNNALEKARLRQELRDRQEELDRFASMVTHDLRSPISTAIMLLEMIEIAQRDEDSRAARSLVENLRGHISAMAKLVRDLHTYAIHGLEMAPFETVNFNEILVEARNHFAAEFLKLSAVLEADHLPVVEGDPVALKQLLMNLIGNALKYCREGVAPEIHLSATESPDFWIFHVRDNGAGISKDSVRRIFQPFYQINKHDPAKTGSGLGLALCVKIVSQHGGKIWVQSTLGEGSDFGFTLRKGFESKDSA